MSRPFYPVAGNHRYKITAEEYGSARRYVLRYCGSWLAQGNTKISLIPVALKHAKENQHDPQ